MITEEQHIIRGRGGNGRIWMPWQTIAAAGEWLGRLGFTHVFTRGRSVWFYGRSGLNPRDYIVSHWVFNDELDLVARGNPSSITDLPEGTLPLQGYLSNADGDAIMRGIRGEA